MPQSLALCPLAQQLRATSRLPTCPRNKSGTWSLLETVLKAPGSQALSSQPVSQPQWVYDAAAAAGLSFPPGCFICHLIWCQIKVIYRERACISCDILIKNASCLCTSHYRLNLTQRIAVDSEIRLRHLKALAHPSPCIRVMSMARGKSRSKILKAVSKHLAGRSPAALEASLYLG